MYDIQPCGHRGAPHKCIRPRRSCPVPSIFWTQTAENSRVLKIASDSVLAATLRSGATILMRDSDAQGSGQRHEPTVCNSHSVRSNRLSQCEPRHFGSCFLLLSYMFSAFSDGSVGLDRKTKIPIWCKRAFHSVIHLREPASKNSFSKRELINSV